MVAANAYPVDLQDLLSRLSYTTPHDVSMIEHAYFKAQAAHEGQTRKSGEPYFTHCVAVAGILADLNLDSVTIAAGLLHDVLEDTQVTEDELIDEFGTDVTRLVEGVTKLTNLPIKDLGQNPDHVRTGVVNKELEYFRKMFMMMDDDVRVVLVKLADRLHNMRTLTYMPLHKQKRIAQETLDIFAPLANRLGIWQLKWELEDLSFRYLEPDAYRAIASSLDERRADRERYIQEVANKLRVELDKYNIQDVTITGRPKHIFSIYRKMQRKSLPLDQIYDVRAVRVIVEREEHCYLVLGIVHRLWRPIPGEFDDYIAAPKDNFYRSLHTAVLNEHGKTLEVQIRTREMHEHAEYGIAAHWRYKEGKKEVYDEAFEKRIAYLRRLMENGVDSREDAATFLDRMKTEVFQDRVYAFTPKGDIIDLPVGATPIDFAYHIHTDVGHRCRGAKIHGRLVGLDYQLKTGDQVTIQTAKRGGPSMDWLNQDLGYVKTSRARGKIRHWFRRQNREKHVSLGREALERELRRLGVLDKLSFDSVAHLFDMDHAEELLAAIGAGDITGAQITNKVLESERRAQRTEDTFDEIVKRPSTRTIASIDEGVSITGTSGLLVSLAKCCNPTPGEEIIGYVTRGRGVTVHRADCVNITALPEKERERLLDVAWGHVTEEHRYSVPLEVIANDREGLLRDITTMIADEKVNISTVNVKTRQHIAILSLILDIADSQQLARIIRKIESIPNVVEAHRRNHV
ncbi:bifunctional (p)ppGpp synthetase/guanosine-3',5'-bis(diphosphate) 3'-pyrophosphohydrolase [Phototrophicus methaneseepsis]|uniref:Bifunctional (P)ppGpp synthetase/guanosine-3',5'-bis(Diphosphate) 3'-pyrophosphohydrolase n=1 Tax=Phototrophicus methaneseepsis TaxID=2710758 RepID=A0A7S8E6T9_9CHLR|nr:bifunctional (p)ppGpp synthetase/guanosine-3',5'-bis(diphosphate) 3'-pyrophosphohydrolase [Phototrophicus methaneseepsis]QPC81441.1 bifunctional (p)ppGpp synthetase/guanosine-3',5'-bis(diphosphate) 3'-pyrophosphohydrolase [Phototrophicus methaneseepsis]